LGTGNDVAVAVVAAVAAPVVIAHAKTTAMIATTTASATAASITPPDPIVNIANRATTGRHGTGNRVASAIAVTMDTVPGDMCSPFADAIINGAVKNATVAANHPAKKHHANHANQAAINPAQHRLHLKRHAQHHARRVLQRQVYQVVQQLLDAKINHHLNASPTSRRRICTLLLEKTHSLSAASPT